MHRDIFTFEKEEVMVEVFGTKYLCFLEADLDVEITSYDPDVEAPSSDQAEVMKATTKLIMFNDDGDEVGDITVKGLDFFSDCVGTLSFQVDPDDGRLEEH